MEQPVAIEERLDYKAADPAAYQTLLGFSSYLRQCGLEESLLDLLEVRASQLNGCAYCLDMHAKDALASGETPQRLVNLDAWRESPFYTARERAALDWAEAVTQIASGNVPDEVYQHVRPQFGDQELVALTMAVIAINSWNRINVAFRTPAGLYQSKRRPRPA